VLPAAIIDMFSISLASMRLVADEGTGSLAAVSLRLMLSHGLSFVRFLGVEFEDQW
jgi:hypothetical protein